MREIHTGFYSDTAKYLLGQMLNILRRQPFYMSKKQHRVGSGCEIKTAPNGEILLVCTTDEWYLPFRKLTNDIDARNWIAYQLKLAAHKELQLYHGDSKHAHWKRDDKSVLNWYSGDFNRSDNDEKRRITVSEIYCFYDLMRARQKTDKRYSAKLIDGLVGHENDPFTTEQENVRRAEIIRLNKEKDDKANALRREKWQKQEEAKTQLDAEYAKLIDASNAEFDAQIKQLNDTFEEMRKLAAVA